MTKKAENVISTLLDWGRFTGNERLAALAAQTHRRYPAAAVREIADDELSELFAAGDPDVQKIPQEDDDER